MKSVIERKQAFKKKQVLRAVYQIGCLMIAAITSALIWAHYNVHESAMENDLWEELIIVGVLYCVIYWIFSKMYHAIKLGEFKVSELGYFQLLSFGISTAILVVASMLWYRTFSLSMIMIGLLGFVLQMIVMVFWVWGMNKIWFYNTEPRRVVLIYGSDDYSQITKKIESLPYAYDLKHCFSDTTPIDELKQCINSMDCVYLYKVHRKVRREIVIYCNQVDKDVFLSREVEDLITKDVKENIPLVSVVIATYKRELSLEKAIKSIIAQSYENIEIVVVDDNANIEMNSKVLSIVSKFQDENRILYIKNERNLGSAQTRNKGIEAANGEYVTFLDDDDIYLPDKVKKQLYGMMKNNADYSITDLLLYTDSGVLCEHRTRPYLHNVKANEMLKIHLMYHLTGTDTMMFRKDYLMKIGCFDPIDIGDEFYLMQKAIAGEGKFYYLPDCDVKAYVHTGEGGLSSGQQKINGENDLFEYKKKFFHKLDVKARRYIKMRHHAVIAFAYLRIRKFGLFFVNGVKSFVSSPLDCAELVIKRKV